MTYEEAIKILTELKPIPIDGFKIIAKAYDLAIETLELQIAKKPLGFGNEAYLCPSCKRNNFYEGTEFLHRQKRCSVCGQAIDWRPDNGT